MSSYQQKNNLGVMVSILLLFLFRVCSAQTDLASFVFGDSLVDAGNNNYIVSLSKANYDPNGIDFGQPTGRFTNGRTIVDIIGQELGLKNFVPPYLAPTTSGDAILNGVNYASGGGGILNCSGKLFGGRINMDAQIDNFANTRQDIISRIGVSAALDLFGKSIFSVTMGNNDFINNYLIPPQQQLVPPETFVNVLISRYRIQLTRLYALSARKVLVANMGPIGCIPFERDTHPLAGDDCAAFPNQLVSLFNSRLNTLVVELNANLKGSMFVYANVYGIVLDIIQNSESYGFVNFDSACCHLAGRFGGLIPCTRLSKVCADRSQYVFWDPFHPTEAANIIIANRLLDGGSAEVFPINVRQLAQA